MSAAALASAHDSLLLDLDGTVWEGGRAIPGAVEAIVASGVAALYVTNNASRAPGVVAEMLRGIGLGADSRDVITSAEAAVELVASRVPAGSRVLVLGSDSFKDIARSAGFDVVDSADDEPAAVLHGHNPATGWAELSEAALAIRSGAVYVASNVDSTLPMERGLMVGNGSMVAAVTHATGVVPDSAGKPAAAMFHSGVRRVGASAPLAVGDRLDTDIAGAVAAGIPSLHVLTGVSGFYDLCAASGEQRPVYVGADMSALGCSAGVLSVGQQGGFSAAVVAQDAPGHRVVELSFDADAAGVWAASIPEASGGAAVNLSPQLCALRTVLAVLWESSAATNVEVRPADDASARALEAWW